MEWSFSRIREIRTGRAISSPLSECIVNAQRLIGTDDNSQLISCSIGIFSEAKRIKHILFVGNERE
jgi:hypothetical protein